MSKTVNSKQQMSIYIPRILGSVTRKDIVNAFHNQNIGKVYYLDMHKKINDKRYKYYFAFLSIELYDTTQATIFETTLNKNNITKLVYDEESNYYWEIKKYISRDLRTPSPPAVVENNDTFQSIGSLYGRDDFDLVKEYEKLEREIYAFVNQYSFDY